MLHSCLTSSNKCIQKGFLARLLQDNWINLRNFSQTNGKYEGAHLTMPIFSHLYFSAFFHSKCQSIKTARERIEKNMQKTKGTHFSASSSSKTYHFSFIQHSRLFHHHHNCRRRVVIWRQQRRRRKNHTKCG